MWITTTTTTNITYKCYTRYFWCRHGSQLGTWLNEFWSPLSETLINSRHFSRLHSSLFRNPNFIGPIQFCLIKIFNFREPIFFLTKQFGLPQKRFQLKKSELFFDHNDSLYLLSIVFKLRQRSFFNPKCWSVGQPVVLFMDFFFQHWRNWQRG